MSHKNFTTLENLGKGSFGSVDKVIRHEDGECYAMKKVSIMKMKEKDKRNALNEVRLLASLDHPNIINYKEAFYDEQNMLLCTVMELAENGDLAKRIKQKKVKKETFYEYEIWRIGYDIFCGMDALHEKKIIHRDIKPANIFFGEKDVAKIGDMNVSLLMKDNLAYSQIGTPFYASPEIWNNDPYGYECDIWSLGCVLYEMCSLKRPFEANDMGKLFIKIRKCQFDPIPYRFSEELAHLITQCLTFRSRRIKNSELRQIFERRIAPKVFSFEDAEQENPELIETIKLPAFNSQLTECLPKSKYESEREKQSILNTEQSLNENQDFPILSSFLKPKPGSILHQRKKSYLEISKSQKTLPKPLLLKSKKESIQESPSFNRVISLLSPTRKPAQDYVSQEIMNLRRQKIRRAMYGS